MPHLPEPFPYPARGDGALVSSTRLTYSPAHAHVCVWNRGGFAGELTLKHEDGAAIVQRLEGHDLRAAIEAAYDDIADLLEHDIVGGLFLAARVRERKAEVLR